MAITLLCPDPNGDCPADDPNDPSKCSNTCDVSCDCPDDYEYRFLTYGPNYDLSPSDEATLENDCGGPGSYDRLAPVDSNGNPIGMADCYDVNDPAARVVCYKCNGYGWGASMGGFAAVGVGGSSVYIG